MTDVVLQRGSEEARRWAWVIWGITIGLVVVRIFIGESTASSDRLWEYVFAAGAILAFATVGALIISRQSGNRVGLLLSGLATAAAVSMVAGEYASLAAERDLPLLGLSAWLSAVGFVVMLGPLAFLFLLFPTGRVLSPRWRWLLRVMLVAYGVAVIGFSLTPGTIESGFVDIHARINNPIAFPAAWRGAVQAVTQVAGLIVFGGAIVSVLSLVLRFRRADAEERQQIRWLAYLAEFLGVFMLAFIALAVTGVIPENEDSVLGNVAFFVAIICLFFGIPAACGIAILRYHLYELDVVIKKTILYAIVALLLVAMFLVFLVTIGNAAIEADPFTVVALVLMGIAVLPAVRIARWVADKVVYRGRTSPYEALTTFSHRVADTYGSEDVLPRMATILLETTRARSATVWLRVGNRFRVAARAGELAESADVAAVGDEAPTLPGDHVAIVRHQGELLGALTVEMAGNDPIDRLRVRLVDDLAAQAGAVLRNVRLIEDLRASRQRLVAAQDDERRRLERNIHDGAQQQLVALAVKLRLADGLVERDPAKARALIEQLHAETDQALEDLRDLARGIYPPLLADKGLAAALEAQSRKSAVPVEVHTAGVGRYPQDVEAAIYFSCLEALSNTAKYAEATRAEVRLEQANGTLMFSVADDGRGFDRSVPRYGTGLQGIADRIDAIGGTLDIVSAPGQGTTVSGKVPVEVAAP